jgi:hypothetical protein
MLIKNKVSLICSLCRFWQINKYTFVLSTGGGGEGVEGGKEGSLELCVKFCLNLPVLEKTNRGVPKFTRGYLQNE